MLIFRSDGQHLFTRQPMRLFLFLLFLIPSFIGRSQKVPFPDLFFDLPIFETRDSIYNFCLQHKQFRERKSEHRTFQQGKEIKTFNGDVLLNSELKRQGIDSIRIQVSTGSLRIDGDTTYRDLLPVKSDYFFSKERTAKRFYKRIISQFEAFTSLRMRKGEVYEENLLIGFFQKWMSPVTDIKSLHVQFEQEDKKGTFRVIVNCTLYE